jgi:hypothetical protein
LGQYHERGKYYLPLSSVWDFRHIG